MGRVAGPCQTTSWASCRCNACRVALSLATNGPKPENITSLCLKIIFIADPANPRWHERGSNRLEKHQTGSKEPRLEAMPSTDQRGTTKSTRHSKSARRFCHRSATWQAIGEEDVATATLAPSPQSLKYTVNPVGNRCAIAHKAGVPENAPNHPVPGFIPRVGPRAVRQLSTATRR